jgi:sigma-B regulation protein RsbU (phosphoserine phosphatase)
LWGSFVALTPLGLLIAYAAIFRRPIESMPESILITCALIFCLFPLTVAYVVVADRAMDLRVVIRQGVRYTLAKGGLRIVLGLAAAGLLLALSKYLFGSGMRRLGPAMDRDLEIGIYVFAVLVVTFLVRKTRSRLMAWVDRKFFREAYNSQKILEQLSESVHGMVDEDKMLDTVARQISASLHVPQFAVLMNDGKEFKPVYCLGFDARPEVALPENSKTVEVVKEAKNGARINFEREDNWVHSASDMELLTLKAIHAQLLLPLTAKDKLLGILSLGQKLSEEPYSASDVQILRSVSVQTALAIENSRLTKAVATEIAQREKLNREIEIAREVQERLFPQRLPAITGIDYYGTCRPAQGVGGDYYDFLALPDGDLGIAIGDVSGKGIAAALLMASLQASLRGQALVGQGDLAQLMTNVNQLVFDATPVNRYATFFYGQFHRESRLFRYVNAGHNPPIVLRRSGDNTIHVIRLETGGPVVGLFPKAPYQEGALTLLPGDIFVGFTDGISEAMNKEDEEWGEERLIPAIAAHAAAPAADIVPYLIKEADRFVNGAPQHDDMTLVVMKLSGDGALSAQAKMISSAG